MLSLVLIALAAPAASAPPPQGAQGPKCHVPGITSAGNGKLVARPHSLADEPPAQHYLAVDRQIGGCPEPALVRSGIVGR